DYLGLFWPTLASGPPRSILICSFIVAVTAINLFSVRDVAASTNILTVGKLAPLALFIVAGLYAVDLKNFSFGTAPSPAAFSEAMLLLVYAYTGFEIAVIPAAEVRDPRREMPGALLAGIGIVALFYFLIQVVCIRALPELSASDRPLADAASRFLGPTGA